jgi:hypothetical protein
MRGRSIGARSYRGRVQRRFCGATIEDVSVRAGATLVAVLVSALASAAPATSSRAQASTCGARAHQEPNPLLGTLGRSRWVAGSPRTSGLIGVLFGGEVVNGRLAVYAGGVNPGTRANEKILWIVSRRKRAGSRLAISGRKDGSTAVTYRRRLPEAGSAQVPGYNYPSILDLPVPGCWKLTLRTGRVTATVSVLAQAAH